jgi:hypothetical protein
MTAVAMTSQVPAVIDYLVAAAQASLLLGANPDPAARVVIVDGPTVTGDTLAAPLHLWVGCDDPTRDDVLAAAAAQKWGPMDHGRTRDEDGEVWCTADAWSGSTTMSLLRGQCSAIVGGVEALLRGVPADGGPGDLTMGGLVYWSGVDGPFTWSQRQNSSGAGASCAFRVTYRARLTTMGS